MDAIPTSSLVIAVIGIVSVVFFLRWLKAKGFGEDCIYCGGNARFLERVNEEDRAAIRKYFHQIEERATWHETILVCDDCKRVYAKSQNVCKVCKKTYKLTRDNCVHCDTPYEWMSISDCGGYKFLIQSNIGFNPDGDSDGEKS